MYYFQNLLVYWILTILHQYTKILGKLEKYQFSVSNNIKFCKKFTRYINLYDPLIFLILPKLELENTSYTIDE